MIARFNGVCTKCGGAISKGDEIRKEDDKVHCSHCIELKQKNQSLKRHAAMLKRLMLD